MGTKTFWAVRCWHWKKGVDTSADEDVADQQEQKFRRVPSETAAHSWGKKMAADPLATSPGLYDVMRGTPDRNEWDGVRWDVHEEVRP